MHNSTSTFSFASPPVSVLAQKGPSWPRPTLGLGSLQAGSSAQPSSDGKKDDGQQNTNTPNQGTSNPPYQPFLTTERDGPGASINSSYNSITCTPSYGNLSLEELRLQDYQKGKNPSSNKTINNNNISVPSKVEKNKSCNEDKNVKEDEEDEEEYEEEEEESDKDSETASNQKQQETLTETISIEESFKLYVKEMMKRVIKEEVEQLFKDVEMIALMQETIKDDIRSIIAEKVKNV